jgi:hypothetical protein
VGKVTFCIRIVADCVALSCQVTRKLKRATTFEFTTDSAIIFIHCYRAFLIILFIFFTSVDFLISFSASESKAPTKK